jgi:hypothetical protein
MTINAMISIRLFYFGCMFIVMVLYGFLLISLKCSKGGDKANATHSNLAPKLFLINKFVTHSYSAYNLSDKKLPENCEICIENFKSYPEKLIGEVTCSSKHIFHVECLNSWLKRQNACPICKEIIN